MSKTVDITKDFFDYVKGQDTKIAKRVGGWIDQDFIREIIVYYGTFWYVVAQYADMPKYVHDYVLAWGKRQGYKYIY